MSKCHSEIEQIVFVALHQNKSLKLGWFSLLTQRQAKFIVHTI